MLKDVLLSKGLSNREAEVADLLTLGLSNKEIASCLFVTEKTIKFHLTNIYKKMSLKSRSQLIVWCLPHMSFVEKGQNRNNNQGSVQFTNSMISGQQNAISSIPAGNHPIGGFDITDQNTGFGGNNDGSTF